MSPPALSAERSYAGVRRGAAGYAGRRNSPPLSFRDFAICGLWFAAAWLVYARFGLRLARGVYLDYYNLAFDFDPPRTLSTLVLPAADPQNFRHPLMLLLRPLARPFLAGGLSPKEAAVLVMVTFGAGTVALCSLFLRAADIERREAAALTLLFAVTGTQLFTSIIVESFGISGFAIALIWLIAIVRLDDPRRLRGLRYVAALLAFGVTITNLAQALISEMLVRWRHRGLGNAIAGAMVFGLICLVLAAIPIVVIWHAQLWQAVEHPTHALRQIYWMQPTGQRTGVKQVLLTFFGFSFVSPKYSWVVLAKDLPIMRDFRSFAFMPVGWVAMPLWFGFWLTGAIAAAFHPRYRWPALGLLAAIVYNVALNTDFQDRGSLYLYSAHAHFVIFALGAGLAPSLGRSSRLRGAYLVVVLVLAVLIGADNLTTLAHFTASFDNIPPLPG